MLVCTSAAPDGYSSKPPPVTRLLANVVSNQP